MPLSPRFLRAALLGAVAVLAIAIGDARADQAADLEKGQKLYQDGKHAEAETYLSLAIDGPAATIKDPVLVQRGRMLRGASDLHLGRRASAIKEFEQILHVNPKFEPDQFLYPAGILEEFKRVRERLEKEAAEKAKGDINAKQLAALKAANERLTAQVTALKAFAAEERVVTKRSRLIATLPFGIGQFQNGDTALGTVFLATEVIAFASATISFAYVQALPAVPADKDAARANASTARTINLISVGSFIALAIGGIVHAHISFVPETYETRPRPLPKDLARVQPVLAPLFEGGAVLGLGGVF